MTDYAPNLTRLGTINAPDLPNAPQHVREALTAQDRAVDELFDHYDQTEHLTADDWEQRAEAAMLVHAAANEPYEGLMDQRRTERVTAITQHRRLEQQARQATREARRAVHDWLRQPGVLDSIRAADQAARDTEHAALTKFLATRRDWLRTAGIAQWAVAATAAPQPSAILDYTGGPATHDGYGIEVAEVDRVTEAVQREHERADSGTSALSQTARALIIGPSGVPVSVPNTTADQLIRGSDRIRHADPQSAA